MRANLVDVRYLVSDAAMHVPAHIEQLERASKPHALGAEKGEEANGQR